MDKLKLMKITNEVRKDIVTAVHSAKAGHPKTETDLCCPRDIQPRHSTLFSQSGGISRRRIL